MNGTSFKAIEITGASGETFEGSAALVWTAVMLETAPESGELGGWEAYASFAYILVDGLLYTRDELGYRFGKEEVTRLEAYFEGEALPEELNQFDTVYDDDGAAFDAAAILRAAEPHLIAAE